MQKLRSKYTSTHKDSYKINGLRWQNHRPVSLCQKSAVLNKLTVTVLGLVVTSTFDLLTSKYNQFIFVSNCTSALYKILRHQTFST